MVEYMKQFKISILTVFLLPLLNAIPVNASSFDALCSNEECRVVLSPDGIKFDNELVPLDRIVLWDTRRNYASPSSVVDKGRGALVGGLAGAALLGPVGLVLGAGWGSSEESSGNVQPDLEFKIVSVDDNNEFTTHDVRFLSNSSARRFRMQLPMFTNLSAGQSRYLPESESSPLETNAEPVDGVVDGTMPQ